MTLRARISSALEFIRTFIHRQYDSTLSVLELDADVKLNPRDYAGVIVPSYAPGGQVPQRSQQIIRNFESQRAVEQAERARNALTPAVIETRATDSIRDAKAAARAGGRVSVESQQDIRYATGISEFIQMNTDDQYGADVFDYSEKYVRGIKSSKLLEMLSDASPEMSRALFDFLMMCVPGWEIKAVNENEEIDPTADAYLDECIAILSENYKAPEVVFVKYFLSAFLRGALSSEVVLDKRGTDFVDIALIDPDSLEFRRVRDPKRGLVWRTYQRQGQDLVSLDIPQVAYIPIHPFLGSNKGRPLARPAIFVCFFLIATLQDLRRVIRQQGYPRVDIAVNIEKLKAMIPTAKANDMTALRELAEGIVNEVKQIYKGLKPDDTFVHTEVVEVNQPVGTLNATSLGVVGELLQCLERMATRALKTMPLMMATTDGVSEANANRQWEIHVAGIKSMQHYAESILENHFNLCLRAKGFQAKAVFRFSELRAAELLRDAQVEAINTEIARKQYDNGSISADEMAKKSAGKDEADVPEPRTVKLPAGLPPFGNTQPEPGGNRSTSPYTDAIMQELMRMTAEDIAESKELYRKYAPKKAKELIDATLYETEGA